jgi:hypothetical protein
MERQAATGVQYIPTRIMEQRDPSKSEARLDDLFRTYRAVCPDPEPSVNFIPNMWARIETREISTTWFGRVANVLLAPLWLCRRSWG